MKKSVAIVLLNDKNEICLVSRKDDHNNFGLIGGKVDDIDLQHPILDETEAAGVRETKEETGLDIFNLRLILVCPEGTRMAYTYLADWSGEINHSEPHVVKWGSMEDLLEGTFRKYNLLVKDSLDWLGVPYKASKISKDNRITFNKNKDPYGWLSNMSPYPIEFDNKSWRTTEALFQALRFSDENIREAIRLEKSPMAAKSIAKSNADMMVITQLGLTDISNMRLCLRLKIEQHPELKIVLKKTGNAIITEDVTARGDVGSNLFWGALFNGNEWIGKNTLGNLWMELRSMI